MSDRAAILRFAEFELDTGSGELRRNGDRIKLPPQPFRVLELLVRHGGNVLTRADIRERIWQDSYVDFEQGLTSVSAKFARRSVMLPALLASSRRCPGAATAFLFPWKRRPLSTQRPSVG